MDYAAEIQRQHEYLGQADDHQRGYYAGLVKMLFYAQAQVGKGPITVELELTDLGYGYSPTGTAEHAAHFYSEQPNPPQDMKWHKGDPLYLFCMKEELDSEAGIYALHQELLEGAYSEYLRIQVACSEDAEGPGIPDDFPGNTWEELEQMRDRIAELDHWNQPSERSM